MKNSLKRYLPNKEKLQKQGSLSFLANFLHDPNIWHLNRRSAAGGAAIGMFCAFIPLPVHTISSAIFAILLRVNLSIAVVFSFFTNPVTIPPLFFYAHKTGTWLLGEQHSQVEFHVSWDWFSTTFLEIWEPLLLGCLIFGSLASLTTYILIRIIWRYTAINRWLSRQKLKKELKKLDLNV